MIEERVFVTKPQKKINAKPFTGMFTWVAQRLKHLLGMRETQVRPLGREDSPREGNGNPLQYSCLENPMEGGAW